MVWKTTKYILNKLVFMLYFPFFWGAAMETVELCPKSETIKMEKTVEM